MKRTIFILPFAIATTLLFLSCSGAKDVTSDNIPYTLCERYFVRNDAETVPNGKITTKKDFDRLFGEAATMGSLPTAIDFSRQFVIAVSERPTDYSTDYKPVSLCKKEGKLLFTYSIDKGKKRSYTIQPLLLITVDKKYEADVECKSK